MATMNDIAQILSVIATTFPNFKMQPRTPDIYLELLQDLPADELKAAVLHCCSEPGRAFAPSIGEIRGGVLEVRQRIARVPSSYEAWEEVRREMVNTGSYRRPVFSHPVIEKAVDTLGWRNLCLSDEPVSDRMRFIDAYEQLSRRVERESIELPQVNGYIEHQQKPLLDVTAEMHRLAEGKKA